MSWDGQELNIEIDEVSVPLPSRLRGRLRLIPEITTKRKFALDSAGRHHWWPVTPRARVEVDLQKPALHWRGSGYFDSNSGSEPLESAFTCWHWSRAHLKNGAALLYNAWERSGAETSLALRIGDDGVVEPFPTPAPAPLPSTFWRVNRVTRADLPEAPQVLRTLEDSPFYARSLLTTRLLGQQVTAIHESLDLDRFRHPVVQLMLPFRMPRRG